MAYTPLEYPDALTHKYWNKKKGVIARMKNDVETGIGDAADEAAGLFKKIDWDRFDIVKNRPAGNTQDALDRIDQLVEIMRTEWTKTIKPTIDAVKKLETQAKNAVPELKKAKYNDAAKAAGEIESEAKSFVAALQLNGIFFSKVNESVEEIKKSINEKMEAMLKLVGDVKPHLSKLLVGLSEIAATKLPKEGETPESWLHNYNETWNKTVKNPGRSVGNFLKSKKGERNFDVHLNVWNNDFKGFSLENMALGKIDDPSERMVETKKLLQAVVAEAKELRKLI